MKNKALLLLPICLLLSGCQATTAYLQHPETKHAVECKVTDDDIFTADPLGKCVRAYESAGYVRIDLPADRTE